MWAQGTGYGTGDRSNQDPVWDAAASEMAQRARDEELSLLLESLGTEVSCDLQLTDTGVWGGRGRGVKYRVNTPQLAVCVGGEV